MKKITVLLLTLFLAAACTFPDAASEQTPPEPAPVVDEAAQPETIPVSPPDGNNVIDPNQLTYLGAFRLPEASGGSSWEYSGHGLTYRPAADQAQSMSGTLYGFGHDQQLMVSEISIPDPVISQNLDDLNTAETIQPFADISGGLFVPEEMTIPRAGLTYHADRLYFAFGQHIQDFEPSHGSASLDLAQAQGAYRFDGYSNYVTNDYLLEIPETWATALGGYPLASGRAREGLWSGRGPALFAYQPDVLEGDTLTKVLPLLLYGEQQPGLPDIVSNESMAVADYHDADHWWGAAWLTAGERSAVIFAGTKALGDEWYGFANGVVWDYSCSDDNSCPDVPDFPYDDRGFWAADYQAQIIFYDPALLVAVARGELESWQPQPYAVMDLTEHLFAPELDFYNYKRDLIGAIAFDREHGRLYVVERLADDAKSIIHVWQVGE